MQTVLQWMAVVDTNVTVHNANLKASFALAIKATAGKNGWDAQLLRVDLWSPTARHSGCDTAFIRTATSREEGASS